MDKLDIVTHKNDKVSIKDPTHDVNLSEAKWDFLIKGLNERADNVYFYGLRISFIDDELYSTIDYLSEEMLLNEDNTYNRVLFRIKPISLIHRGNLHHLWEYYNNPVLIFLKNRMSEDKLLDGLVDNIILGNFLTNIDGYYLAYVGVEMSVLWIDSDQDITWIPTTQSAF